MPWVVAARTGGALSGPTATAFLSLCILGWTQGCREARLPPAEGLKGSGVGVDGLGWGEEGTTWKIMMTFTWMPRPESGPDCLICTGFYTDSGDVPDM